MNKQIHVIGFCGKAGCGKSTASQLIILMRKTLFSTYHGVGVFPLASELKRIARDEFGWNGEKDDKGRKLLQLLGTDCGRMYGGENFWVNKWQACVDKWSEEVNWTKRHNPIALCDDVRFDNEAQHIKDIGGYVIHMSGRAFDMGSNNNHPSEAGISDHLIDFEVDNSTSLFQLEEQLRNIVNELGIL